MCLGVSVVSTDFMSNDRYLVGVIAVTGFFHFMYMIVPRVAPILIKIYFSSLDSG